MKVYCETSRALAALGGEVLGSLLAKGKKHAVLFLSSGGSALSLLDEVVALDDASSLTVGILDERLEVGDDERNEVAFQATSFFNEARANGAEYIAIDDDADAFERAVRSWRDEHPRGVVIVTLGIGADGHTAGIMPYGDDEMLFMNRFDDPDRYVVSYDTSMEENAYPQRISVTLPFLRQEVDHAVVVVQGDAKKEALADVFAEVGDLHATPARIIHEMNDVVVITDQKVENL